MSKRMMRVLAIFIALEWNAAHAVDCSQTQVEGKSAIACRVDTTQERLQLFLNDESGAPIKTFAALEHLLAARNQQLVFAMNAGMFHPDYSPVGLFIDGEKQVSPLNRSDGAGNFFLKPNGVFFVGSRGPRILESNPFTALRDTVSLATQSGPLLVQRGVFHPRLGPKSPSRAIRNGVGVDSSGTAIFAITNEPMNLYEFAKLFRDVLQCPDALYFDGAVSSIYVLRPRQNIQRAELGPIIAIVKAR